ncbi:MAG: hypothetical protein R6V18_00730 [Desulfuromonadaceae bacterium]
MFSLYLLQQYSAEKGSAQFYEESFPSAFSILLEDILCSVYTLLTLVRFAGFMGLVVIKRLMDTETPYLTTDYNLTKRPLLDVAVRFNAKVEMLSRCPSVQLMRYAGKSLWFDQ